MDATGIIAPLRNCYATGYGPEEFDNKIVMNSHPAKFGFDTTRHRCENQFGHVAEFGIDAGRNDVAANNVGRQRQVEETGEATGGSERTGNDPVHRKCRREPALVEYEGLIRVAEGSGGRADTVRQPNVCGFDSPLHDRLPETRMNGRDGSGSRRARHVPESVDQELNQFDVEVVERCQQGGRRIVGVKQPGKRHVTGGTEPAQHERPNPPRRVAVAVLEKLTRLAVTAQKFERAWPVVNKVEVPNGD